MHPYASSGARRQDLDKFVTCLFGHKFLQVRNRLTVTFSDLQSYHSTEMRVADHFRGSRLSLEWRVVPAIAIRVMSILRVEVMLDLLWCLLAFIGPHQETYSLEKRT